MMTDEIYNESINGTYTTWLSLTIKSKNGRQSEETTVSSQEKSPPGISQDK